MSILSGTWSRFHSVEESTLVRYAEPCSNSITPQRLLVRACSGEHIFHQQRRVNPKYRGGRAAATAGGNGPARPPALEDSQGRLKAMPLDWEARPLCCTSSRCHQPKGFRLLFGEELFGARHTLSKVFEEEVFALCMSLYLHEFCR